MSKWGLVGCGVPFVWVTYQYLSDSLTDPTPVLVTWPSSILMIATHNAPPLVRATYFSISVLANGVIYAAVVWFVVRAFNKW
jgi:hypothetical protein